MLTGCPISVLYRVLGAGVMRICETLYRRHLVEGLLGDVRVVVHAKEEAKVEHALQLSDL